VKISPLQNIKNNDLERKIMKQKRGSIGNSFSTLFREMTAENGSGVGGDTSISSEKENRQRLLFGNPSHALRRTLFQVTNFCNGSQSEHMQKISTSGDVFVTQILILHDSRNLSQLLQRNNNGVGNTSD
jgi:hypothetical protein